MAYETDGERLKADLNDPLFTCYVHVGKESDDGWQNAIFVHGLVTRLNLYIFHDHQHLRPWIGNTKPKAIAFGWKDKIKQKLTTAEAGDLGAVTKAIVEAQE